MKPDRQFFDRWGAIVRRGWLPILRPLQKDVYWVYLDHLNKDGVSYPGTDRVAEIVGSQPNHVRSARKDLVKWGLLSLVSEGGGAGKASVYRLPVPGNPPTKNTTQNGTGSKPELRAGSIAKKPVLKMDVEPVQNLDAVDEKTPPESGQKPHQISDEKPHQISDKEGAYRRGLGRGLFPPSPAASSEPDENQGDAGGKKKAKERTLTPGQQAARKTFSDWWVNEGYPAANHGVAYDFQSVDGRKVLEILRHPAIGWDAAKAREVASHFLRKPDLYFADKSILKLKHHLGRMLAEVAAAKKGVAHVTGSSLKPTPEQRGEYARRSEFGIRRLGGAGADAGASGSGGAPPAPGRVADPAA